MRTAFLSLLHLSFAVLLLSSTACDMGALRSKVDQLMNRGKSAAPTQVASPTEPTPPKTQEQVLPAPVASPQVSPSVEESVPPAPSGPGDDVSLIEKINGYIACSNRTISRTSDSRTRYLTWANEKIGPTCTERYISYGLYTLYEDAVKTCNDAVERGKALPPSMPQLEQAAADLAQAYAELVPLTQKASDYYQQEDYKDDSCAGAKAMHPQLMAAFNKFIGAEKIVSAELDGLKAEIDVKELARLEREQGKTLAWQTQNFMMNTRLLIRAVPKENTGAFDSAAYLAAYNTLQSAYDQLIAYSAANAAEASGAFWFNAFENSAKGFFTKAKFLKRDVAEGKKPDARALNDLIDSYNRVVGDANNLRFK